MGRVALEVLLIGLILIHLLLDGGSWVFIAVCVAILVFLQGERLERFVKKHWPDYGKDN